MQPAPTADRKSGRNGRAADADSDGIGTIGFYGRSTAIGWETCEEIERVRTEVLRRLGFAGGESRAQIYASREAGGLDHRHAYQHATAVLLDEIEKVSRGGFMVAPTFG